MAGYAPRKLTKAKTPNGFGGSLRAFFKHALIFPNNEIPVERQVLCNMKKKQGANCEYCVNYSYDDDYECYTCDMNLDEDEMYRFITGTYHDCPYFRMGDEYRVVRKQM